MFYEGNLQSGISLALKESKSVACFIRDDGDESSKWEDEFLGDAQVRAALTDRAITLRIKAGSQEAQFLSAYYPVKAVPALTIIRNGSLVLDIGPGQDKAAFKAGVLTTLIAASSKRPVPSTASSIAAASTSTVDTLTSPSARHEHNTTDSENQPPTPAPVSFEGQPTSTSEQVHLPDTTNGAAAQDAASNSASSSSAQQSVVQRLLEERRKKLEVDKEQKDAAEKADRKAKAEARKESTSIAPNSAKAKQATYAQEQRKRNADAKLERERVLRQIEQDKIERREKEERRKALAKAEASGELDEDSGVTEEHAKGEKFPVDKKQSNFKASTVKDCAVQVRLFDGSTIRNRFPTEQTLVHVREWVDQQRSDDTPFTFKQILSPSPNRSLTISEENESLAQLRFVPSATLVIVPIKDYIAAYTDSGPGIISSVASIPYNAVAAGAGLVSGAIGSLLGFGQAVPQEGESLAQTPDLGSRVHNPDPSINIRTLHDQRREQGDHQLYNGNHINVEPRTDDSDKDK